VGDGTIKDIMAMSNKDTYDAPDVVNVYAGLRGLQKPEATILRDLKNKLKNMKMLDIGVGAGRTTYSFASSVKEYVGIDYSVNMVESCKNRLSSFPSNASFEVCDVRDMGMFEDNLFDFILFSFNGIDSLCHEDRLQAFREMRRVAKRGGLVCFSTHNVQYLTGRPLPMWSANPAKLIWRFLKYFHSLFKKKRLRKFRRKSFKKLVKNNKYVIVNDGVFNGRLTTYYIKPEEQLKQLADCGFSNIRIYSLESGKEILDMSKIDRIRDGWLYFLCEVE
jgi:ubiquinone/menaquinone biosynthesis C-methylase UbiE